MMMRHELKKNPGQWRPGSIYVQREESGEVVYEGPDRELIPGLIAEMLAPIRDASVPPLVRAAMAHLNLVMIHPFSDGNGRMARCLQTLVLARDQIHEPTFASIEEYLGRNTQSYYDILEQVGQGAWHPENDARPWLRFCLTAHYRQARTLRPASRRNREIVARMRRPPHVARPTERVVGPIVDAARGIGCVTPPTGRSSERRKRMRSANSAQAAICACSVDARSPAPGRRDAAAATTSRQIVCGRNGPGVVERQSGTRQFDDPFVEDVPSLSQMQLEIVPDGRDKPRRSRSSRGCRSASGIPHGYFTEPASRPSTK